MQSLSDTELSNADNSLITISCLDEFFGHRPNVAARRAQSLPFISLATTKLSKKQRALTSAADGQSEFWPRAKELTHASPSTAQQRPRACR
jgi:hypothetical protein